MDSIRRIQGNQVTTILRKGSNDRGTLASTGVSMPTALAITPNGDLLFTSEAAVLQITQP